MKNVMTFGFLILMLVGTGCRSFTSPARLHKLKDGVTWLDYDATRRGAIIVPPDSGHKIVSEPSPDVAIGVVADLVAKGNYSGASAEASTKLTETVAELGKRTQTVMVLRELLFRVNELQLLRPDLNKDEIKSLYLKVMETILALAESDKQAAETAKIRELNLLIQAVGKEKANALLNKDSPSPKNEQMP